MAVMTWWLDGGAKIASHRIDAMFRRLAIEGMPSFLCWQALALTALDVLQQVRSSSGQSPAILLSGALQSMMRVVKTSIARCGS